MHQPSLAGLDAYVGEASVPTNGRLAKGPFLKILAIAAVVQVGVFCVLMPAIENLWSRLYESTSPEAISLTLRLESQAAISEPEPQSAPTAQPAVENEQEVDSEADVPRSSEAYVDTDQIENPNETSESPANSNSEVTRTTAAESEKEWRTVTDLESEKYNENIFDPRVREKILSSRQNQPSIAKPAEPYSFVDSSGTEIIVNGDTCYKAQITDELMGTVLSLPYRCPWVPTLSEKMMANVNAAMRERFQRD